MRYNNLPAVKDSKMLMQFTIIYLPKATYLCFGFPQNPVPVILGFSRGAHWGQTFALT